MLQHCWLRRWRCRSPSSGRSHVSESVWNFGVSINCNDSKRTVPLSAPLPVTWHGDSAGRVPGGFCGSPYVDIVGWNTIHPGCSGGPRRTDVPRADTEIDWTAYMEQTRLFAEVQVPFLVSTSCPAERMLTSPAGGTECLRRYETESMPEQCENSFRIVFGPGLGVGNSCCPAPFTTCLAPNAAFKRPAHIPPQQHHRRCIEDPSRLQTSNPSAMIARSLLHSG